jgi:hypothetical protein
MIRIINLSRLLLMKQIINNNNEYMALPILDLIEVS